MLGYFICAGICIIGLILTLIIVKEINVKVVLSCIFATAGFLMLLIGFTIRNAAIDRYNKCLNLKQQYEEKYEAKDILSEFEAHEIYFKYRHLYEEIVSSVEEDGYMSQYYWLDIKKLELNVN